MGVFEDVKEKFPNINQEQYREILSKLSGHPFDDARVTSQALSFLSLDNESRADLESINLQRTSRESRNIINKLLTKAGTDIQSYLSDPFGDGDQSPVMIESKCQILRELWSKGGDIEHYLREYPESMPKVAWMCARGDSNRLETFLNKTPREQRQNHLERRSTSMRLPPLILTVALSKHPNLCMIYTNRGDLPPPQRDFVGVVRVLLKYGANPLGKDVTGKTICHYGAGSWATDETLEMTDMAIRAAAISGKIGFGRQVILNGLSRAEFNNKKGIISGFVEKMDRCNIYLTDEDKEIAIKPENVYVKLGSNKTDPLDGDELINLTDECYKREESINLVEMQDRLGSISLHEVVMSQRQDVAKFLVKRGSDRLLDIQCNANASARKMIMTPLPDAPVNEFLRKHAVKTHCKVERRQILRNYECANCKHRPIDLGFKELQWCTGCLVAAYCSRECQLAHWKKQHKKECKVLEKQMSLALGKPAKGYVILDGENLEMRYEPPENCKPKAKFWIKVQVSTTSEPISSPLRIYDETRTCLFHLEPKSLGHKELVAAVSKEKAFDGLKSYFQAKFAEDGNMVVFPHTSTMKEW